MFCIWTFNTHIESVIKYAYKALGMVKPFTKPFQHRCNHNSLHLTCPFKTWTCHCHLATTHSIMNNIHTACSGRNLIRTMIPLLDRTQLVTVFWSSTVLLGALGVEIACWEALLLEGVLVGVLGVIVVEMVCKHKIRVYRVSKMKFLGPFQELFKTLMWIRLNFFEWCSENCKLLANCFK